MYNFCEFYSTCRLWIFSIIKTCHNILGLSSINGTFFKSLYCKMIKKNDYYHNDTLTLIWLVSLSSLTIFLHHYFQENYYSHFLHLLFFSLLLLLLFSQTWVVNSKVQLKDYWNKEDYQNVGFIYNSILHNFIGYLLDIENYIFWQQNCCYIV
jgi:hypothetical protein